ncbi:type II 3-dehydroquinate dehydratase [Paludicola sp. MB14-C6]|uniref:type II 3-dehydroquinate dehydratase n=1 Tax=Paludihabitans sp. MB14-C6 TaxID=3070656 RepID=UPI0027DD5CA7|nr:type II 3-dehydroquinate dehydratase [Paludicola sp. MB14-C6]WMJ22524.1 type II 3-dehydroquinate dehydratase [Paludicola sp. MB14-C6]
MKLLVINGPNLNMLGIREPNVYGKTTYLELESFIKGICVQEDIQVEVMQSNHEGVIVDTIQAAYQVFDGIVINPAAFTHTSIAILDALKAVGIPTVEVHLSNIYEREEFRHISYISNYCIKTIYGEGIQGYQKAIMLLKETVSS